jgi:hypothetical protein
MTAFRRTTPSWQQTLASGLLGASLGAVTFYLARMLLARERLPWHPETPLEVETGGEHSSLEGDPRDPRSLAPGAEEG